MDSMQPSKGQKAIIDSLGLGKPLRWIAPWAGFVLAVLVGRIFAKESLVDTGVFIVGMRPHGSPDGCWRSGRISVSFSSHC